jgi:hypothetical protein
VSRVVSSIALPAAEQSESRRRGQQTAQRNTEFIDLLLHLREAFHLRVQFVMNVIDLCFDDLEHIASLRRRCAATSRPFWTDCAARTLEPRATSGPGWAARATLACPLTHPR